MFILFIALILIFWPGAIQAFFSVTLGLILLLLDRWYEK
jgi:hypothetical protein